jgi:hypothetical protein
MLGNTSGFATLVKKEAPHVVVTHCFLHRHALATKTLPTTLKEVLPTAIKVINFIRSRSLNHRILKKTVKKWEQNIVISSQVLVHDGSLLHSKVQYTTVDYN